MVLVSFSRASHLLDDDDGCFALVVNITGNFRILLRHAVLGIDDDERNVAAAYGSQRTNDAVTLDGFFFNGTLAAYARRYR